MCADTVEQIDKEIIIAKNFPLLLVFLSVTISTSYLSSSVSLSVELGGCPRSSLQLLSIFIVQDFIILSKLCPLTIYLFVPYYMSSWGFPRGSVVKNLPACRRLAEEMRFDPSSRKWQPTPVFLPGKSHGQWSLEGFSPWGHKTVQHNGATKQQ